MALSVDGGQSQDDRRKNESIEQLWLQIETLWRNCKPSAESRHPEEAKEISALIEGRAARRWKSEAVDWALVNEVECRIGSLLGPAQLFTQYLEVLAIARQRHIAALAQHEENAKSYFAAPLGEDATPGDMQLRRDTYLYLLSDLQSDFIKMRTARRWQREAAGSLLRVGITIVLLTILLVAAAYFKMFGLYEKTDPVDYLNANPSFGLMTALMSGLIGAFFSRLTRFQSQGTVLDFAEFHATYLWIMLMVRLLTGLLGALVFYFLMRSQLVSGTVFPDLSKLAVERASLVKGDELNKEAIENALKSLFVLAPNAEFAKLIIWSFIAGFSERLVPDSLARTEARAAEKSKPQ